MQKVFHNYFSRDYLTWQLHNKDYMLCPDMETLFLIYWTEYFKNPQKHLFHSISVWSSYS